MAESSRSLRRRLINGIFHLSNALLDPVLRRRNPCRTPAVYEIPDELVWEILTWLPVKSLMRFKSVSRRWLSIITDPSFATAYRGGLRGLFAYEQPDYDTLVPKTRFYRVNLDEGIATQVIVDHGGKYLGYTNFVDGLICFYSANYSWLYNFSTRERFQLPVSVDESLACGYHFGFDPVSKLYKLLKICPVYEGGGADPNYPYEDALFVHKYEDAVFVRNMKCEILTIGLDATWRVVDSLPPVEIVSDCVCFDGALYWLESDLNPDGRILSFDLAEEKFQQFIPVPPNAYGNSLAKFGPRMALFTCATSPEFDYPSIFYYSKGESRDSWGAWSPALKYQFAYGDCNFAPGVGLSSQGILPNGKVLMYVNSAPWVISVFDPIKREFEEIVVTTVNSSGHILHSYLFLTFFYYVENIMPLRCLTSCP